MAEPNAEKNKWWRPFWEVFVPVWELVVHIWTGSFFFAIAFVPAILLDLAISWLAVNSPTSEYSMGVLKVVKYGLVTIDAILYLVLMVNFGWLFVCKLGWKKVNHG